MAIPPVRKDSFEIPPPSQECKAEEPEKIVSDAFQKAEIAIPKAIDLSNSSRKEKLQRLSPIISRQVETLEKNFAELRELCLEVCFLNSKSKTLDDTLDRLSSDDESEREGLEAQIQALEEPIEEAEKKMKALI